MAARYSLAVLALVVVLFAPAALLAAQAEAPLYPLWPETRPALNLAEVRHLYRSFIKPANSRQAPWFGKPATCETGSMDPAWVAQQERLLNAYRMLAGAGETAFSPEMNAKAIKGALITAANHFPPEHYPKPSARCYTKEGAEVTAASSLAYGAIKTSIDDWINDYGVKGVGHRLPTLHPGYPRMGMGAVGAGMVLLYPPKLSLPEKSHIAVWPPAGFLPAGLAFGYPSFTFSLTPVMQKGHTLDMKDAMASVTVNGWPRPVAVYPERPYGSFLFEVAYGDRALLKKQLQEKGYIAFDVSIGPVVVNGSKAEIRYRTVYFDPEASSVDIEMPVPGFFRLEGAPAPR